MNDSEIAQTMIDEGLTPAVLQQLVQKHVQERAILAAFGIGAPTLAMLRRRWGLHHLSGRDKSNVTIILEMGR